MPSYILGINSAYHESSAALVADGHIVAAVEEERLNGVKHGKPLRVDNADALPWEAIETCLEQAGITWRDLEGVAYSLDPALRRRHACLGEEGPPCRFGHPVGEAYFQESMRRVVDHLPISDHTSFFYVPHHEAHAWYALGTSTFTKAAILVIDGIGEGATISLGRGDRRRLHLEQQTLFPASIGLAWEKVARYLGMSDYDASKVMALAGLAEGTEDADLGDVLVVRDGQLHVDQGVFDLEHPDDYRGLERRLGRPRNLRRASAIAAALQAATERCLLDLGRWLKEQYDLPDLAYGGGVALNCRANEALARSGLFDRIHAGPASHDAGTALGAAWWAYVRLYDRAVPRQDPAKILFSGPDLLPETSLGSRTQSGVEIAAEHLLSGGLVPWAVGPCEFGPRALGARSLLAPPWRRDVVDLVNATKGRWEFEPLALSVTAERAEELFDIPPAGRILTDAMLVTVRPRGGWRERLAHLVHGDGSVRLQVVRREWHPLFHDLLEALDQSRGWPLVVNTSLNPRGQPMAARLPDIQRRVAALGLDALVCPLEVYRCAEGREKSTAPASSVEEVAEALVEGG